MTIQDTSYIRTTALTICSKYSYLYDIRENIKLLEKIIVFNLTYMMSVVDIIAIGVRTLMINSLCSFEK